MDILFVVTNLRGFVVTTSTSAGILPVTSRFFVFVPIFACMHVWKRLRLREASPRIVAYLCEECYERKFVDV